MFAVTEQRIMDRLREKLPAEVHVGAIRELEKQPEMRMRSPAVWVMYDGYRPGDAIAPGAVQQVVTDWYVVASAKSARGNGDPSAARDEADALCDLVLDCLLGFNLTGKGNYLRLQEAPGPEYDAGQCFVPIAFSLAATFKGRP